MSFIYKCKTSTLTPFVKLRNILNLMYKTYFMYNQPCVQSERFFTNKFCKIIITSTKKSWTTICLMAYAESAIMYNPGCWWDLFKNSPIWSHWLQRLHQNIGGCNKITSSNSSIDHSSANMWKDCFNSNVHSSISFFTKGKVPSQSGYAIWWSTSVRPDAWIKF